MTAETRGVAGAAQVQDVNVLAHHTLTAGNKIAFFSFDPLSVDTQPDYYWFGEASVSPQVQTLKWFDVPSAVQRENNNIPGSFELSQNYPNPFNPSTTIKFSIPQTEKVVMKVYDMLGREVANLLNETKSAGNYTVSFDASKLASGVYVYSIQAGDFKVSKKMMLLK